MLHRDFASHPERGASYVSVVWPIVLGILFLGAVVFGWTQSSRVASVEKSNAELEAKVREAESHATDIQTKSRAFAAQVGYVKDGDGVLEAAKADFDELKKALGKDAPAGGTIQDHIAVLIKVAGQRAEAITARDNDLIRKDAEIASKNSEVTSTRSELQRTIDEAASRARDEQSSLKSRITNLEGQIAQKETAVTEANAKLTAVNEQLEKTVAEWTKKYNLVDAKNSDLNSKLSFMRSPAAPKGSVVEVSDSLPIAYIDLGQHERVVAGMRFEVCDYDANRRLHSKGFCEVTMVEDNMSRVRLEAKDKNSPITKGDLLLNPLFDPKGERKAVLVGRFPLASGGKKGVEQKLSDLGIKTAGAIDASTDYLIVGDADYSNTGEKQDLESDAQVLAAAKFGTLRYSLKELEGFFRR